MKLLIDLTNNGNQYVELSGEKKKVLAAMAGLIVSSPELGALIKEAIKESDRAEKERPDLCARMREDFKNNAGHIDEDFKID
tara:strand:+ start:304 stop:549 length:246 start_codon:yes stop_codon:yes gene_type:complete